jgi:hypothetical protein
MEPHQIPYLKVNWVCLRVVLSHHPLRADIKIGSGELMNFIEFISHAIYEVFHGQVLSRPVSTLVNEAFVLVTSQLGKLWLTRGLLICTLT